MAVMADEHDAVQIHAVRALKLGAFDFISKPLDLAALRKLITATLKLSEGFVETGRYTGLRLLGDSKPMQQLRQMIEHLGGGPVTVLGSSLGGSAAIEMAAEPEPDE